MSSIPKADIDGRGGMKRSPSAAETKRTETSDSSDSMPTEKDSASLSGDKESINVPGAVSVDPMESNGDHTDKKTPAPKDDLYHGGGNEPINGNFYKDPEQGEDDAHAQAMAYLQSSNGSEADKEKSFQNSNCDEIKSVLDEATQSADGEVLEEAFDPNNREAPYPGSVDTVTSLGNILVHHLEERMRNMPIQDSVEAETRLLSSDDREKRLKMILELAVREIGPRTDTDHVAHAEAFDPENRQAPYPGSSDTTTSLASLMIHFFEEKIKSEPSSSLSSFEKVSTEADTLLPAEEDILKSVFDVLDEFRLLNVDPSIADSSHQFVTHRELFDPDNRPAPYPGNSNTTLTLSSLLIKHLDEKVKADTSSDTEISAPTSQVAYELEDVLQSMITVIDELNPATNNEPEIDTTEYSELDEAFDPDNRAAPYPGSSDTSLTLTRLLIRHLEDTVENSPPRAESSQANQIEIIRLTPEQEKSLVAILEEAQKEIEEAMTPP